MKIKKNVLAKVHESPAVKKKLMSALNVSAPTISRYIDENDDNLTKAASLKIIGEYFNLTTEQILSEEKAAA